jgi:HEAT repeat protein
MDALILKSREGDIAAVEALGRAKDETLIPALSRQLSEARNSNASPVLIRTLRKSLARLGDPASRNEIRQELASKDRYVQYHAFEDAAVVGGDEMIVAIAEKLFDPSPGGRPRDEAGNLIEDVSLPAPRHAAVIALSRIIADPSAPRIDLKRITYNDDDVQQWRKWWQANMAKFKASR